ncbi:MAG: hypothetical protein NTV46_17195 [Verrucomicrobia bacterium]|nr:hypothetical protein [Verrucomicrobiota bacterium]
MQDVPSYPNIPSPPSMPGDPDIPGKSIEPAMPDGFPGFSEATNPFSVLPGASHQPSASADPSATSQTGELFANMSGLPLGSVFKDDHPSGFSMSATLTGTYDTNVAGGQASSGSQQQDDYFFSLGADLSYLSKGYPFTFGGNYRGRYDQYCNLSDFSGYSQGGGLIANYEGSRVTATATAGYNSDRGSPRNYNYNTTFGGNPSDDFNQNFNQGDFNRVNMGTSMVVNYQGPQFSASLRAGIDWDQGSNENSSPASSATVESTSIHAGLTARYRLTNDIWLTGNADQNSTTWSGGNYGDTNNFDLGVSALWKYSVLTEFGPGIHYTSNSGDPVTGGVSLPGRTSIGPSLTLNYQLGSRVTLASMVAMDFPEYDNGQSADPTVSAAITLNYQASPLWGMNLSYDRDVQADPSSPGAFYESNALRLGYHRQISQFALNLGVSYLTSSAVVAKGLTGGRPDSNTLSLDSSLSMPIFANTGTASVFVRYYDQSGVYSNSSAGGTVNSWDSFQTGFSISRSF